MFHNMLSSRPPVLDKGRFRTQLKEPLRKFCPCLPQEAMPNSRRTPAEVLPLKGAHGAGNPGRFRCCP